MTNRISERKILNLEAEIFAGDHRYTGIIEDISTDGIYIQFTTAPTKSAKDLLPTNRIKIKFQLPSGEKVELTCESRWINIYREPPDSLINQLGIQIIDPPRKLKDFIESLPSVNIGS